jgi:hypothetical protein
MKLNRILVPVAILAMILMAAGCGSSVSHLEKGGINANDLLDNLTDKTTRILSDVVNVEAAKAALPQLQAVNEGYDRLIDEAQDLSPNARIELSDQARKAMPGLKENARRMNSKRGVEDIIGPEMNKMVTKLSKLL